MAGKVVASRIDTDYRLFPRKEKHFHLSRKEKVSEIWKLVDLIPHRRPIPPSTTKIQLLSCSRNGNRRDYRHRMEEVESFQPASGQDIFFFLRSEISDCFHNKIRASLGVCVIAQPVGISESKRVSTGHYRFRRGLGH